jgi:hypothetical protein
MYVLALTDSLYLYLHFSFNEKWRNSLKIIFFYICVYAKQKEKKLFL